MRKWIRKSVRNRFPALPLCLTAVCATAIAPASAQVGPEGVSAGIPYLAPTAAPEAFLPPPAAAHRPDAHLVPEPGYRPSVTMTELPGPYKNKHNKCICGSKSLLKKVLRKKCRVHPDVPPTFVPNPYEEPPLGSQVFAIMNTQVRNNDATRQVLNHYDFVDDSDQLNYAGKRKLMRIAQGAQTNFAPIVVESTPRQPGLDHQRRERLTQEIVALGLPIPAERVIVGQSHQQGLRGPDAIILYSGTTTVLGQGAQGAMGSFGASAVGGMTSAGLTPSAGTGFSGGFGGGGGGGN